ncbi:MAG: hypothetical protein H6742_15230 [Alphaproteobacteria bacterium]|nr:hypothetical protein [Alphaproteobacteria bacterium]
MHSAILYLLLGGCTLVDKADWESANDRDGDGFLEASTGGDDCDDTDASVHPGVTELCNGIDDDCDGVADEAGAEGEGTWYLDGDGDGFGLAGATVTACARPEGYAEVAGDCDDGDGAVFPGAPETWYDGLDADCGDGGDFDADGDGHDSAAHGGDDCDDTDEEVHPDASEVWYDGVDSDCDGQSDYDADRDGHDSAAHGGDDCDDADAGASPSATETWYDGVDADCDGLSDYDADQDGHNSDDHGGGDCDDGDSAVSPSATEVWYDGVDADCDGLSDYDADGDGYDSDAHGGLDCSDADAGVSPGALEVWYDGVDSDCGGGSDYDADADGHDSDAHGGDDCDDTNGAVSPDAAEVWYDGVDSNCDGAGDYDADADGHDSDEHGGDDCDDGDGGVSPDAAEVWYDGVDSDCDDASDYDADGDGYDSDGYGGHDCDDGDAGRSPGADETWYDGVDQDCDGASDYDADGDGFEALAYYGDDCDDEDPEVSPAAWDTPGDDSDANCDGEQDAVNTVFVDTKVGMEELSGLREMLDVEVGLGGDVGEPAVLLCIQTGGTYGPFLAYSGSDLVGAPDGELSGTETTADLSGYDTCSVDGLGDYDGDGVPEFAVGAFNSSGLIDAGYVLVLGGDALDAGETTLYSVATARIDSSDGVDRFGYDVVSLADLDDDSRSDVAIGTGSAYAYVFRSTDIHRGGEFDTSDAHVSIQHSDDIALGRWLSSTDVDGDGLDELFVNPGWGDSSSASAFVFGGDVLESGGSVITDDATAVVEGPYRPLAAADLDGDGYGDFVAQAWVDGEVVALGFGGETLSGTVERDAAWFTIEAESGEDVKGHGAVGDVDGDGALDLAVAGTGGSDDMGRVDIFASIGERSGRILTEDSDWAWFGDAAADHDIGGAPMALGDVDGDGVDDLVIASRYDLLLSLSPY